MQRYNAPKRIFLAFRQKLLASFTNPAQNASYLAGIGRFVEMETRLLRGFTGSLVLQLPLHQANRMAEVHRAVHLLNVM